MTERPGFFRRLADKATPSREEVLESRWLKPFGKRIRQSDLWRFTRRSVPRGVAIGLLVGIFIMIPGLQIIGSALLCIPFRGNIPIAALMTFLSNPFTTPFILLASLEIGAKLGFRTDIASFYALRDSGAGVGDWFAWLFSDAAPALVSGLFIIGVAAAAIGYLVSVLI